MMKKRILSLAVSMMMLITAPLSVFAADFVPSSDQQVNIICSFEKNDWLPMTPETITDKDTLNQANLKMEFTSNVKYTGSRAYQVSCTSDDGGYGTFEWYQVQDGKHIYERNGHTELTALYEAGKGYRLKDAEYLQLYVKNEANGPVSLKWGALYGEDCWDLKPFAKHVMILKNKKWENLTVSNTYITVPRKYEGFIRIQLIPDNFKKGTWDQKELNLNLITAFRFYLDITGTVKGNFYVDDLAVVGKNLNAKSGIQTINEKDYFKAFLGESGNTAVSSNQSSTVNTGSTGKPVTSTASISSVKPSDSSENTISEMKSSELTSSELSSAESSVSTIATESAHEIDSSEVNKNSVDREKNQGSMTWLVVIIIVIIVLAGGGAALFFFIKKKRNS